MADTKIQMPGAFGGLVRYDEEYKSRFMLSPAHVIALILLILLFVIVLHWFWPLEAAAPVS